MKGIVPFAAIVLLFGVGLAAPAGSVLGDMLAAPGDLHAGDIRVRVGPLSDMRLRLDYWPPAGVRVSRIRARLPELVLAAPRLLPYPAARQRTAVVILVDTSDPARGRVVRRQAAHIATLLARAGAHIRFALARFDTGFAIAAPFGSGRDAIVKAARRLRARGLTTELFRNTRSAVALAATGVAARRAVILMSDGRAEDTAYSRADVVKAARADGVRIFTLGYALSAAGTRAFQRLRRLSEETGGLFIAADSKLDLPTDFAARIIAALDAGGRAVVDLAPAVAARLGGARMLTVTFARRGTTPVSVRVPISLPAVTLRARLTAPTNRPYVIAGGVGLLVVLGLAVMAVARRRRRRRAARQAAAAVAIPFAFLEFLDDTELKAPVHAGALRLGRGADNDVQMGNSSVSIYHAEIQRRRDGTFIITDLDSLNGVAINDERVDVGRLGDGDIVELGDVRFRFVLNLERTESDASTPPE